MTEEDVENRIIVLAVFTFGCVLSFMVVEQDSAGCGKPILNMVAGVATGYVGLGFYEAWRKRRQ